METTREVSFWIFVFLPVGQWHFNDSFYNNVEPDRVVEAEAIPLGNKGGLSLKKRKSISMVEDLLCVALPRHVKSVRFEFANDATGRVTAAHYELGGFSSSTVRTQGLSTTISSYGQSFQ
jgi:hypothetical protein